MVLILQMGQETNTIQSKPLYEYVSSATLLTQWDRDKTVAI